ncbi:MAG: undecaprenyl-phosphate glucose phosphotransferase [Chloroflexi bacterium]|nr:undecaprenyl-phosphate glucose phosphotransferase [Chloroflexota bacterium]
MPKGKGMNGPLRGLRYMLIILDAIVINIAFAIAYIVRYRLQWFRAVDPAYYTDFTAYLPFAALLTLILLAAYTMEGLYGEQRGRRLWDDVYGIINGTTTGLALMIVGVFFWRPLFYSRLIFIYTAILVILLLILERLLLRIVLARLRKRGIGVARVLIIGAGEMGRRIMRNLMANPDLGYRIVGFLDDDPSKHGADIGPFRALGDLSRLPQVLQEENIDEIIITLPWQYYRRIMRIMAECERSGVRARVVPDLFQLRLGKVEVSSLNGIPLISVRDVTLPRHYKIIKRLMDLTLASVAILIFAPIMAIIAVAIKLDSPNGPILFKQKRIGKDGVPFYMYKFRSMIPEAEQIKPKLYTMNEADGPIFKIKNDPRTTRVGRIIRRFSLDELPQFFNVLRGEMSLVGPRPALPEEVAQYEPWHYKRLQVRPGITGLWQISGRSDLSFDEMMLLDIYYVENWSPWLDVRILFLTIPKVIMGEGAY